MSNPPWVILDACCIINLYASEYMLAILSGLTQSVAVAAYVERTESLYVLPNDTTHPLEKIDLQPAIAQNLLTVVDVDSSAEADLFIDLAAALGDDGEAVTAAIAVQRIWQMATDDRKTTNFLRRQFPELKLLSTPELVKIWVDTQSPDPAECRVALQNIQRRGSYTPAKNHLLYTWWLQHLQVL